MNLVREKIIINNPLSSGGGSGVQLIEKTYAEAAALIAVDGLLKGKFYLITDRADMGIMLQAATSNQFALRGTAKYLNPDFQDIGNYSGLVIAKGTNRGVWYDPLEDVYANSDIVFWNGIMYQVINSGHFSKTSPDVNDTAYTPLTKGLKNGYILEIDTVDFDFENDTVIYREDKRNNCISMYTGDFQFGNDNVRACVDKYNTLYCINQRGAISQCINNSSSAITFTNDFTATVSQCEFGELAGITFINCGNIINCYFNSNILIYMQDAATYNSKTINTMFSNFEESLNMSTSFAGGVLTIPPHFNYVGVFILLNDSGSDISEFANSPYPHEFEFMVEPLKYQTFTHAAIAGAGAGKLVSDAETKNVIVGRVNGSDFIKYRLEGNLNVRTNIAKLA